MPYSKTPEQIDREQREEWSDELVDLVDGRLRQGTAATINQLRQQVTALQTHIATQAKATMMASLDRDLPSWRAQNEDQGFIAWLNERDGLSARLRMELLHNAWNACDASRVLAIFRGYSGGQRQPYNGPTFRGQDGMLYRGSGPQGRVITRQAIDEHHQKIIRGGYNSPDPAEQRRLTAEKDAFDVAMVEAAKEGRIR